MFAGNVLLIRGAVRLRRPLLGPAAAPFIRRFRLCPAASRLVHHPRPPSHCPPQHLVQRENHIGLIDTKCSPAGVCQDAIDDARSICMREKGSAPEVSCLVPSRAAVCDGAKPGQIVLC